MLLLYLHKADLLFLSFASFSSVGSPGTKPFRPVKGWIVKCGSDAPATIFVKLSTTFWPKKSDEAMQRPRLRRPRNEELTTDRCRRPWFDQIVRTDDDNASFDGRIDLGTNERPR
jgi:hypothetical protein